MTYFSHTLPVRRSQLSFGARIIHGYNVWRQRQVLKRLDAAALADIGISRKQAEQEANRAIWDLPVR